jgi:hypothetical protein
MLLVFKISCEVLFFFLRVCDNRLMSYLNAHNPHNYWPGNTHKWGILDLPDGSLAIGHLLHYIAKANLVYKKEFNHYSIF